jgi:hypothetical protein
MWGFFKRRQPVSEALASHQAAIHSMGLLLKQTEERLAALEAAHERLRGRFYALRGPEPGAKKVMSKEEILANFRAQQKGS